MPAFQIASTQTIDVAAANVRDAIADFNTWPTWSPWLIMEPDSKLSYQGTAGELGHGYEWEGDKVGSGAMVMTALDANRIECDLEFLKPWKSHADIAFDIESIGASQTKVTWHMDSSLPFFMFFMLGKMKAMIKSDYDRGLSMLKDYLEHGSVPSSMLVEGVVDVPEVTYAGKSYQTTMSKIQESMGAAFPEVFTSASESGAEITGMPFCFYDKMDLVSGAIRYTAAVPMAAAVQKLPNGVESKERETCRAFKVVHTGSYKHLGNAWATGMSEMRHAKLKANKSISPFEVYVNEPGAVPEAELITELYMPVKG